jgi:hypothetical protein
VTPTDAKQILTLYGDSESAETKAAMEVLDGSGLARVQAPSQSASAMRTGDFAMGGRFPMVRAGDHILSQFTRQQLVEFLWAHGAKFEDS